jgi:glucose-6-phosphate isomerase
VTMDKKIWQALEKHQADVAALRVENEFEKDPERFKRFSIEAAGLLLDYSKNIVTSETIDLLVDIAYRRPVLRQKGKQH